MDYIRYKELDEIDYPFPDFNGCTVDFWDSLSNFTPHFTRMKLLIHGGIKFKPC